MKSLVIPITDSICAGPKRHSRGAGRILPFVALHGYIEARCGGQIPPFDAIERDVERQRKAASEDLINHYLVTWAEAFAARVAHESGRVEEWERLRASALASRSAGPFVKVVLGEAEPR